MFMTIRVGKSVYISVFIDYKADVKWRVLF